MTKIVVLCSNLLILLLLYGCTAPSTVAPVDEPGETGGVPVQETGEYVTDAMGTKLIVPESGDIKIASSYAVVVPFLAALELSDNVVAINYKSIFWAEALEGFARAGSVGRGIVDLEALATFSPDVLIHRANDSRTTNAVTGLGIPVMSIRAENIDEIMSTLDLMGRFFHVEARAEDVKNRMIEKFDKIAKLVENIPKDERYTAIMMGGELGVVAGGDMLQSWMLEHAGAICMASEIEGGNTADQIASAWAHIGMERLFTMNPDVIFTTSSTVLDYSVDEILTDPALSGLEAVKHGRVFQMPAKRDSWDLPGVSCVIGTMWMLHCMYPELLSAEDIQKEIDEYYTFIFGRTFDSDYLGYNITP